MVESANELVQGLTAFFQHADSLKLKLPQKEKVEVRMRIAQTFDRMGLRENAVDALRLLLGENPGHREALRLLADIYLLKRRFAPARSALARLTSLYPDDEDGRRKLDAVLKKWQ